MLNRLFTLISFLLFSGTAGAAYQKDWGAGTSTTHTFQTGVTECHLYVQGPGGGGGAGNANSAGGGGGSGAKAYFVLKGALGGEQITIVLPNGGAGGIAPGGNGVFSTHSTVTFSNGFQLIAGAGSFGYGGNGNPGPGGRGGNVATNTVDQGGSATIPAFITSFGQFNLGAAAGMDGTLRLWGHGGNEGDIGGGGKGGWWDQSGQPGQGGYMHIECE